MDELLCPEGDCGARFPPNPIGIVKMIDHRARAYVNPINKRLNELKDDLMNTSNRFNTFWKDDACVNGVCERVTPKVLADVKKALKIEEPRKEDYLP